MSVLLQLLQNLFLFISGLVLGWMAVSFYFGSWK